MGKMGKNLPGQIPNLMDSLVPNQRIKFTDRQRDRGDYSQTKPNLQISNFVGNFYYKYLLTQVDSFDF